MLTRRNGTVEQIRINVRKVSFGLLGEVLEVANS